MRFIYFQTQIDHSKINIYFSLYMKILPVPCPSPDSSFFLSVGVVHIYPVPASDTFFVPPRFVCMSLFIRRPTSFHFLHSPFSNAPFLPYGIQSNCLQLPPRYIPPTHLLKTWKLIFYFVAGEFSFRFARLFSLSSDCQCQLHVIESYL